jgi:hypothetical protein
MPNRDDFSEKVKKALALRVGYRCSIPTCRASTVGAASDASALINVGVAAHITAASEGGPRYDASLSPELRSAPENGIWVCQTCGKKIDDDEAGYSVELLSGFKITAEFLARNEVGIPRSSVASPEPPPLSDQERDILVAAAENGGQLHILESDQAGKVLHIGDWTFASESDPAEAADYLEALDALVEMGLVKHEGGILFLLTGSGFKVGRKLRREIPVESKNVSLEYIDESGLKQLYERAGFKLQWVRDEQICTKLEIEGWSYVEEWKGPRNRIRFRVSDGEYSLNLIKQPTEEK